MHGTTCGEDLFKKLLLAMHKFNLPFKKLSGFATDGATAMVGSQKSHSMSNQPGHVTQSLRL